MITNDSDIDEVVDGGTSCVKCSSSSGGVRPRPQMGQPYSPASRAPDISTINDVGFDGHFCDVN